MSLPGALFNAIVRPARRDRPLAPLRALAGCPVVFDLASLVLQLGDLRRMKAIRNQYASDDPHLRHVQDYNAKVTQLKQFTRTRRMEHIYQALALPPRDMRGESLLVIGPRNVAELLVAWIHGFAWTNISGIDLYATNPKIRVMNMEAMDFPDASFDNVALYATLSYAEDTGRAVAEFARVLKPGGRLAFNAVYAPENDEFPGDRVSGQEVRAMLADNGMEIGYHHDFEKVNVLGHRQTTTIFVARKADPANAPFGHVTL